MTAQLKHLLDDAADDRVSDRLAERVVGAARRRRTQRLVIGGAAVAVVAVALGVVVAVPAFRADDQPLPSDVAALPAELPSPEGLPTLADAPMDSATAAYVVDGQLVLVATDTGAAAVWAGFPEGVVDSGGPSGGPLRPSQVELTADGTTALVGLRYTTSTRLLGTRLALLDVATGEADVVEGLQLTDAFDDPGWLQPQLMAWSPDAGSFACVCFRPQDPAAQVHVLERGDLGGEVRARFPYEAAGLSWGIDSLALETSQLDGQWWLVSRNDLAAVGGAPGWIRLADGAVALALSHETAGSYLVVTGRTVRLLSATGTDAEVPLGEDPLAFVQAASGGYLVVTRPAEYGPGEPPPAAPLDVTFLGYDGALAELTRLPLGTASASFAADLVAAD